MSEQYKVVLPAEVTAQLSNQAQRLGYSSGNALAAVFLTACGRIPESRVWQALAALQQYQKASKNPRRDS